MNTLILLSYSNYTIFVFRLQFFVYFTQVFSWNNSYETYHSFYPFKTYYLFNKVILSETLKRLCCRRDYYLFVYLTPVFSEITAARLENYSISGWKPIQLLNFVLSVVSKNYSTALFHSWIRNHCEIFRFPQLENRALSDICLHANFFLSLFYFLRYCRVIFNHSVYKNTSPNVGDYGIKIKRHVTVNIRFKCFVIHRWVILCFNRKIIKTLKHFNISNWYMVYTILVLCFTGIQRIKTLCYTF